MLLNTHQRGLLPPCFFYVYPLQYLGDLGCEYVVFPNDAKTVEEIAAMNPRGILVSPGPGALRALLAPDWSVLLWRVLLWNSTVAADAALLVCLGLLRRLFLLPRTPMLLLPFVPCSTPPPLTLLFLLSFHRPARGQRHQPGDHPEAGPPRLPRVWRVHGPPVHRPGALFWIGQKGWWPPVHGTLVHQPGVAGRCMVHMPCCLMWCMCPAARRGACALLHA